MSVKPSGFLMVLALALSAFAAAEADDNDRLTFSGSFQETLVNGELKGNRKSGERFNRSYLSASKGNWSANASFWNYVFCNWHDLDETSLQYSTNTLSAKFGRFRVPVGGSNWDDQWYSTFVFLPIVETADYRNQKLLVRTSTGVEVDSNFGASQLQVSATSDNNEHAKLFASNLKRLASRLSTYSNGKTFGISGFTCLDSGLPEQMVAFDFRATMPQYIFRFEALDHRYSVSETTGVFAEVTHRPKNWQDVTFGARFESFLNGAGHRQLWTLGTRVRLPFQMDLMVNYGGGASINNVVLGGGWALGLNKTFRF